MRLKRKTFYDWTIVYNTGRGFTIKTTICSGELDSEDYIRSYILRKEINRIVNINSITCEKYELGDGIKKRGE